MTSSSRTQETRKEHLYGLLLIAKGAGQNLEQSLDSIRHFTVRPDRVTIVDRGRVSAMDHAKPDPSLRVDYWWTGDDLGVAGSIDVGLRYLSEYPAVLVIDDRTVLAPRSAEAMLAGLKEEVGAVVGRRSGDLTASEANASEVERHQFRWFPSALRADAIEEVGMPLAEVFEGYDDVEYGLRLCRYGYSIVQSSIEFVDISDSNASDSDSYLLARNLTYLLVYRHIWSARLLKHWLAFVFIAPRPSQGQVRKGLIDGFRRIVGPPPSAPEPSEKA